MTQANSRAEWKRLLGAIPLSAEAYQALWARRQPPASGYSLDRLEQALPGWVAATQAARRRPAFSTPRRLLVVGALSWWIEYASALALLLRAAGHEVDLGFVPFRRWMTPVEAFDARRQRAYVRRVLDGARGLIGMHDLSRGDDEGLPPSLAESIETQSRIDVQYTLQRESLDLGGGRPDQPLFDLRQRRNRIAAGQACRLMATRRYDAVVIPNGSILEFGAVFRAARHMGIPAVTYEFGEQRERMWLAQNDEVMRQDTSGLWAARGNVPLSDEERAAVQRLYQARRGGQRWENFARRWQAAPSEGAHAARQALGLDPTRPVALLCTNVVGDSLALGRQVFTDGMAGWLAATARWFGGRSDAQLVVRVHPGELMGAGHPSEEIVRAELPRLPAHVVVVPPDSKVNTYDVMELAHVGLVYTTTVGMEMAMAGIPVIVAGATHYRGRGFTNDPQSMPEYEAMLDRLLREPLGRRLSEGQTELAWRYAYRFFFEYPFRFPWHLVGFWEDLKERGFASVATPEGMEPYERTLSALAGEPVDWTSQAADDE